MMARRGPRRTRNTRAQNGWLSCKGRKNPQTASCLVTPTSCSTGPPPRPPRHPTCPRQLVSWPVLALPTSCVLRHVSHGQEGSRSTVQQENALASCGRQPTMWCPWHTPFPRNNTVLSHTQRGQKTLEAPPQSLTCQKTVSKSSLSKDKVQKIKERKAQWVCSGSLLSYSN